MKTKMHIGAAHICGTLVNQSRFIIDQRWTTDLYFLLYTVCLAITYDKCYDYIYRAWLHAKKKFFSRECSIEFVY